MYKVTALVVGGCQCYGVSTLPRSELTCLSNSSNIHWRLFSKVWVWLSFSYFFPSSSLHHCLYKTTKYLFYLQTNCRPQYLFFNSPRQRRHQWGDALMASEFKTCHRYQGFHLAEKEHEFATPENRMFKQRKCFFSSRYAQRRESSVLSSEDSHLYPETQFSH